jgi:hypothetical protein
MRRSQTIVFSFTAVDRARLIAPGIAPKHRMQLYRSFLFFGARLADLSQLHATKNEAINVQGGTDSMHE